MKKVLHITALVITLLMFQTNIFAQWTEIAKFSSADSVVYDLSKTNQLVLIDTNLFVSINTSGVYLSTNNGNSWVWKPINFGLSIDTVVNFLFTNGTTLCAGTNHGVLQTTNNGNSWRRFPISVKNQIPISAIQIIDTTVFAIDSGSYLYKTSINGTTWTKVYDFSNVCAGSIYPLVTADKNIFVGCQGGEIYRSTDSVIAFTPIKIDSIDGSSFSTSIIACGTKLFIGDDTGKGVYMSSDTGNTWTSVNNGLKSFYSSSDFTIQTLSTDGTNLFAAGNGNVFLSSNYGTNWIKLGDSIPAGDSIYNNPRTGTVLMNAQYIFAATDSGLYRLPVQYPLTLLGVDELSQNPKIIVYPNPSSGNVTIDFNEFDSIKGLLVKITDILGQVVFTIPVNQQKFSFDVSGIVDKGVYFVQILDAQNNVIDVDKIIIQ